ncbi:MAG: inositol monophosphatase family protein, partial [Pseudomonadota bacterium]
DRDTETLIRKALAEAYPDDGIVGEEHGRETGSTDFDWIIDPIDGTANFVAGIPHWCVVIACAQNGAPVVGVIFDPNSGDLFSAAKGHGAEINGKPMKISDATTFAEGSIATGASGRSDNEEVIAMITAILNRDGMFYRSASGALMLAYAGSGRLIGYIEEHMNSWDCFAALIMIAEAGGKHRPLDDNAMEAGTMVVAGPPEICAQLDEIANQVFKRIN